MVERALGRRPDGRINARGSRGLHLSATVDLDDVARLGRRYIVGIEGNPTIPADAPLRHDRPSKFALGPLD